MAKVARASRMPCWAWDCGRGRGRSGKSRFFGTPSPRSRWILAGSQADRSLKEGGTRLKYHFYHFFSGSIEVNSFPGFFSFTPRNISYPSNFA